VDAATEADRVRAGRQVLPVGTAGRGPSRGGAVHRRPARCAGAELDLYLPYGPFADLASHRQWVERACSADDPLFYAIIDTDTDTDAATGAVAERAVGVLSHLRVQPEVGSVEVGHVHYSPLLQRSRAATEAQFLLMRHAFEGLGPGSRGRRNTGSLDRS